MKMTTDNFWSDPLELVQEGEPPEMGSDYSQYNDVYREIAELLGNAAALKIWSRFSGVSITFPRQLYSKDYVKKYIEEQIGVQKPSEIAKAVGLTERRVRQIIRDIKNGKE